MAVDFKVEHTRTSEYLFAPKDIKFKPELNGRHDLPDIEWLIEDMMKQGQLQPVLVRNDGGLPVLVAGFSRWRAAVEINKRKLTEVPFKLRCVYFKGSEQQAVLANISENRVRNSTTPIDDGYNIARLERYGMTIEEIAAVYHEDTAWTRKRLALVSLSADSQAALKDGTVKPNAAASLAKLSEEEQARAVKDAKAKGKAVTAGGLKAARPAKASLKQIVKGIAEGGPIPFDVGFSLERQDVARLFCEQLMEWFQNS